MKTLRELLNEHKKAPKMIEAITWAIKDFGSEAFADVVNGKPTMRKGGNIAKLAEAMDAKVLRIYQGASMSKARGNSRNVVVLRPNRMHLGVDEFRVRALMEDIESAARMARLARDINDIVQSELWQGYYLSRIAVKAPLLQPLVERPHFEGFIHHDALIETAMRH